MSIDTGLIYDVKRKMLATYPRFGSEIAVANIEFRDDLPFATAETDGKNIYVDPNYFESLSENDRLFILAHEIMHIKFMHMYRLMDKDGKKRDLSLWNTATDAIINANLERDGFTIKEGYVNMPEAIGYSAEEFYEKLLQEKKQQEQNQNQEQGNGQKHNNQQNSGNNGQGQGQEKDNQQGNGNNEQEKRQGQEQNQNNQQANVQDKDSGNTDEGKSGGDDHSLWKEAFKEKQNAEKKGQKQGQTSEQQKQVKEQGQEQTEEQTEMSFDERGEFENNRKEKIEKFMARRKKIENKIRRTSDETIKLGNLGKSKEDIDWKVLIRREIEKTETIWSRRRSVAENNYAYRLEENDIEDEAETEIMIDVSGSVELDLVKAFLRQIKPLLKQSKLRVGCFNEKFWGFVDIKSMRDIDNFTIDEEARSYYYSGTDLDLPVRSFSKKREINKVIFTDGYAYSNAMPKDDLKKENVIWLVYGNNDFHPCCGKVIYIAEKQLEKLQLFDKSQSSYEIGR